MENPFAGDLWTRERLTGNWLGARSQLLDCGVNFDFFATQFYQGIAAGGREQEFAYGGKLDYLFNLDGGKLGLWDGLFVDFHAETRYGKSVNEIDGLITPSNIAMNFPEADRDITAITGVKITQLLAPNFAIYFGKINTLDEYPVRFNQHLGGRPGLLGFQNTSLVFNPIVARTIPYSAVGVGTAILREGEPLFTFTVFDPEERATKGLENLFTRGAVLMPDLLLRVKPLGLPGEINLGGTYSNARYRSFDPAAYLNVPLGLIRDERFSPLETGSWSVYANFYQSLWAASDDDTDNWGVFGQFGLSDGNPNPIRFVANGGFAGRSMIPHRQLDTFGIGYFYLGLSDNFKALASPFLPQRDEYGVEVFYNFALTPWCRFTGDLQIARPSTAEYDTAIITGLRLEMLF